MGYNATYGWPEFYTIAGQMWGEIAKPEVSRVLIPLGALCIALAIFAIMFYMPRVRGARER